MATPGWKTRVLRVTLAAVFVVLAAWYSPLITAAGWHLFHPLGRVDYRGLRVMVPWPWTAEGEPEGVEPSIAPEGLSLKKTPSTMDRRLTNQSLFVTVIAPDPTMTADEQAAAWMEIFRATHPGAAFKNKAPGAVPEGATCLSAQSHWNQSGVVWTCISVPGGWVADFEGQTADVPVFFRILSQLKR